MGDHGILSLVPIDYFLQNFNTSQVFWWPLEGLQGDAVDNLIHLRRCIYIANGPFKYAFCQT